MVTMSKKVSGSIICFFLCLCSPSGPDRGESTLSVEQLKVANTDIAGWQFADLYDSFNVYTPAALYSLMDGPAAEYLDLGVVKVEFEHMTSPDGQHDLQLKVMDFGTSAKATAMFNDKKSREFGDTVVVAPYADTLVIARPLLAGLSVCAHYKKFYFEMDVSGFPDRLADLQTVRTVMELFIQRIK